MQKYLTAGTVVLLPLLLTVMVVEGIIDFLTSPFLELAQNFINNTLCFPYTAWLCDNPLFMAIISRAFVLLFLIGFVILVGCLGKFFLIGYLFHLGEAILHRLPIVNTIYRASQEIVTSVLCSSTASFSQVVIVPYPNNQQGSIGFVAPHAPQTLFSSRLPKKELLSVFVPSTPNPTCGFLLMFPREEVTFVDITVEEAVKWVISCGTTPVT